MRPAESAVARLVSQYPSTTSDHSGNGLLDKPISPDAIRRRFFALGIVLLSLLIPAMAPPWALTFFSVPAGFGAAMLVGASPSLSEGVVSFVASGTEIRVTTACSGWLFFCLLCSVGAVFASEWRTAWKLLPAALLLTLVLNTLRIVSWATMLPLLTNFLPNNYLGAAHEIMGAGFFLPGLLLAGGWLHHRAPPPKSKTNEISKL